MRRNPTYYERSCANNVTFHEFLAYINKTHKHKLNEHWEKIHRLCNPCNVRFDVIGKQETFGDDVDYILAKYNLEHLKENTTKLNVVKEEVSTITKYNFDLEYKIRVECFSRLLVAKRLWQAFKYNGYIDRNTEFPETDLMNSDFLNTPSETFIKTVFLTLENQKKRGIDIKSQKRTMMLEEYRKIPKKLLDAIANVYEYDFELFDYSKNLFS